MPYAPTHDVPPGGLPAWAEPDGSQPPATTLDAGLDVQVVEERGQWARVACSNGWVGWVDGSRLEARVAAAPDVPEVADVGQVPEPVAAAAEPAVPEPSVASPVADRPQEENVTEAASGPAFAATHATPADGVQTWATPDPSQPAIATLAAGTEVRIAEQRGQWAQVETANGWTGWVDASRLVSLTPPEPVTEFVAPPEGVQAWQEPDPSQPAVATLHGGTQLHLVEQRGQWAQVETPNGWTVWVDATRLVPRG